MSEKLQKVLADRGFGSRREMERWIAGGRVRVNGAIAKLGDRVDEADALEVDGKRLAKGALARTRVLVMNKREGVVTTRRDPEGRTTVFDALPKIGRGRWIAIGRLDINTSGLLMFTNDGALANRLMHPSSGVDREYAVRVEGRLEEAQQNQLREGVEIDGELQRFSDIQYYDGRGLNHWYHVVLMEGRNREVRQLFGSQGVRVTRLKRVRYGPVVLPAWLRRGEITEMGRDDVAALKTLLRLPADPPDARGDKRPPKRARSLLIPYPELENLRR